MMIPYKFSLGRHAYVVDTPDVLRYADRGCVHYANALSDGHIRIAATRLGKRVPRRRLVETFWHETTHAILHDMGHALAENEAFVTAFAKRLTQVVYTARVG